MSKKKKKDRKTQPQAATVPEKKIIPAAPGLRFNLGVLVFFFLYAFLLYANSLHSPFIWDDKYLITDNHLIKSLRYIPDIFKHHLYYSTAGTSSFYRPLQTIFLILDHALSKNNVIGYHITSIIFHVFCAFFIYLNISALFKRKFIAFMVGLLFLVHPINSTVVNYISSRADSQVTLFVLISVYLFIKYNFIKSLGSKNLTNGPAVRQGHGLPGQSFGRELPSLFYLFGSLFSFILALLSKELGIILPFLILVIIPFISNNEQDKNSDKEQKESFDRFCVFKKVLPYFTVWSIYGVLRFTILKFQSGGGVSFPPLYIRLLTTAESFVRLIVSLFLPLKIHIEKSIPFSQGFSQPSTFFCLIIMIGLAIFIYWVRTRSRICFWGLIWFFVALLPMANIVPINTTLTDHWLYLPCLGLFVSVIGGTADLIKKADLTRQRLFIKIGLSFYVLAVIIFSIRTVKQNTMWQDPVRFYKAAFEINPRSFRPHNELGLIYLMRKKYDIAIREFEQAIKMSPGFDQAYDNLGIAYDHKGDFKKAIEQHKKALAINPRNTKTYSNLGNAYNQLNQFEQAIECYQKALALNPHFKGAYNNLGVIYYKQGKYDQAGKYWEKVLEIDPDFKSTAENLKILQKVLEAQRKQQ